MSKEEKLRKPSCEDCEIVGPSRDQKPMCCQELKTNVAEYRELAALHRLQAFEAAVNEGPAVVFRWRIKEGEWPVEMVTENVRQFGYEAEELKSGRVSWPGITHPDDVPRLEAEVEQHLQGGVQKFHQNYRLITKSGEIRDIEDWNIVIRDEGGNPTHIQGIALDVTDKREEEQRRRESEQKYRRLFETSMDAIVILDPETGKLTSVNPACVKMFRCKDETQMIGCSPWMFAAKFQPGGKLSSEKGKAYIKAALEKGSIFFEWIHRRIDGEEFPSTVLLTRFEIEGKPYVQGTLRDITEQKQKEGALAEERRRLEDALRGGNLGTWEWNLQTGETVFNERWANIIGYTLAELSPYSFDTWTNNVHPDDLKRAYELQEQHFNGETDFYESEFRMRHKNGNWVWVLSTGSVVAWTQDGEPLFMSGTHQDITERKHREQLIVEQQGRLRQLAARLAKAQDEEQRRISEGLHDDVAQLLAAANTRVALARRSKDSTQLHHVLDELDDLAAKANEKIRSLSFELAPSSLYKLDLNEAIVELCRHMRERHGIDFQVQGDTSSANLDDASKTVLFKGTRELLFNVIKHAQASEATVWLCHRGNTLQLTVIDDGKGFPESFEPEDLSGTGGLGLFEVRERLRDMRGGLKIESHFNEGSNVKLWIPLADTGKTVSGNSSETSSFFSERW